MYKRKIFVSFDYENDRHYKYLLDAWSENSDFELTFDDRSPSEIQTNSVSVVKQVLSKKINEATTVIVLAGKDINKTHKDKSEIGCINWQNYETYKAIELKKNIIVVRISPNNNIPLEIIGHDYTLVNNFKQDEILNALRVKIG